MRLLVSNIAMWVIIGSRALAHADDSAAADNSDAIDYMGADPAIDAIQKNYQDKINTLTATVGSDDLCPNPTAVEVTLGFCVREHRGQFSIPVPQFKLKMIQFSFKVPEIKGTELRNIHFKIPETRTKLVTCGRYPKIEHFKIHWEDIKCTIVNIEMVSHDVKFTMIKTGMKEMTVKTLIPVPAGVRIVKIVYDIPTVNKVPSEEELQKQHDQLKENVSKLADVEKSDIRAIVSQRIGDQRAALRKSHDDALASIDQAIDNTHKAGQDPANIRLDDGTIVNLVLQRTEVETQFHDGLAKLDATLSKL